MKRKQLLALTVVGTLLFGVTSATSSYIHEADGTISICDPDSNGTKCITMQDKNLGASEAGTGASSYGKHYQWGNNHGFLPCLDSNGCETFPGGETMTTNERVDTTDYGPQNYFDRAVFSKITSSPYDWSTTRNDNLRGGANDSQANNRGYDEENNVAINAENRRGPCEDGYHVPSQGERGTLLKYWAANYTGAGNTLNLSYTSGLPSFTSNATAAGQFQEDFKIPFAGRRFYNAKVYDLGDYAYLWSSSPYAGNGDARYFYLNPNEASAPDFFNYRALAFSVRCFKDSYLSFPSSEGGPSTAQIILSVRKGTLTIGTEISNLNLGEVNVSNNAQELSGSFGENSFWVEDMKGLETGYYTTISVTDLTGTVASHVISANNVYLKTAGDDPTYISGAIVSDSKVVFSNDIKSWHNNWAEPVTYFNRQNTPSNLAGRVGKWGDNLQVKVNIPAHTPYDTYRGTITYTLYDLDS